MVQAVQQAPPAFHIDKKLSMLSPLAPTDVFCRNFIYHSDKLTCNRKMVIMGNPLRGLTTVSYFAADHAAAKKWYTDFLGIEPYFERPGYVEFRLGDYQHELGIIDSKYVPGTESTNGRAGVVVYWHVDDVDQVLQKALAMDAKLLEAPQDRGQGFITATIVDPFGNILGIMYNPHYLEVLAARSNA